MKKLEKIDKAIAEKEIVKQILKTELDLVEEQMNYLKTVREEIKKKSFGKIKF